LLAEDAHLTALARLTGTGSRDQLAGVS
jgi:hypothetical protein